MYSRWATVVTGTLCLFFCRSIQAHGQGSDKDISLYSEPQDVDFHQSTTLSAVLSDGKSGVDVTFSVVDQNVGQATTGDNGEADFTYTPTKSGEVEVTAAASGYGQDSDTLQVHGTITLNASPEELPFGNTTLLSAELDGAKSGVSVNFSAGQTSGTATTDDAGKAVYQYQTDREGTVTATASANLYGSDSATLTVHCATSPCCSDRDKREAENQYEECVASAAHVRDDANADVDTWREGRRQAHNQWRDEQLAWCQAHNSTDPVGLASCIFLVQAEYYSAESASDSMATGRKLDNEKHYRDDTVQCAADKASACGNWNT